MYKHYEITIKEKGGATLHPSYMGEVGNAPEKFLVGFFALDAPDVESYDIKEVQYCCLCGAKIEGHGNNAAPLKNGLCCDACNTTKVIPERLNRINKHDDGCTKH